MRERGDGTEKRGEGRILGLSGKLHAFAKAWLVVKQARFTEQHKGLQGRGLRAEQGPSRLCRDQTFLRERWRATAWTTHESGS